MKTAFYIFTTAFALSFGTVFADNDMSTSVRPVDLSRTMAPYNELAPVVPAEAGFEDTLLPAVELAPAIPAEADFTDSI